MRVNRSQLPVINSSPTKLIPSNPVCVNVFFYRRDAFTMVEQRDTCSRRVFRSRGKFPSLENQNDTLVKRNNDHTTISLSRESYLRFCSQKFCLTDFHESIHLCNHAIQCKYTNCGDRDPALPSDNMWDATTFKDFLKYDPFNP